MPAFLNVQMGRRIVIAYLARDNKWSVNEEKLPPICKRRLTIAINNRPDPVHLNGYFFFALAVYVTDRNPDLKSKWFNFKRPR